MREDMFKVIVERPRRRLKSDDGIARRLRNDIDGPSWLRTRAGYGPRALNENLAPLRRYLHAQVGRPWNKVFSEISANIDRRNTVQQHIYQHIDDFIAIQVEYRDGQLVDLRERWPSLRQEGGITQKLYVDPRTGLIRVNNNYRRWYHRRTVDDKREQAALQKRSRVIDERTLLLLLNDIWYRVGVEALPAEPRHDVILHRDVSITRQDDRQQCEHLYGRPARYSVSKKQLSSRELEEHGLKPPR